MQHRIKHTEISIQSPTKSTNDDFFAAASDLKLFLVCAGVSGHAGGNVASRLAAETVVETVRRNLAGSAVPTIQEAAKLLQTAVLTASKTVFDKAQRDPNLNRMATTLDAAWLVGDRLVTAHTGDSRVYLYRQGRMACLTKDHTHAQELVESGNLTQEQADKSPLGNALTHAVGFQEHTRVDLLAPEIQSGDLIFMCTDGIYGKLQDARIHEALGKTSGRAPEVLKSLVEQARAAGSENDATALLLEVHVAAAPAAASGPAGATGAPQPPAKPAGLPPFAKIAALDLSSCFGQLSFADKTRLLVIAKMRSLGAGDVLAREGEAAEHLWVLISGKVRISEKGVPIADRNGPLTLGEAALMEMEKRSATVTAVDTIHVIEFERAKLLAFLEPFLRNPAAQIFRAIAAIEHVRVRELTERLVKK